MLEVGVDSYVEVEEATEYIQSHYPAEQREAWEALADEVKEVCLRRAAMALNKVAYRGVTFELNQPLAFPRYFDPNFIYGPDGRLLTTCEAVVPNDIRAAQIAEAFEVASPGRDTDTQSGRLAGVKSETYDTYSFTYADYSVGGNDVALVLASVEAQQIIRKYAGGGFSVR